MVYDDEPMKKRIIQFLVSKSGGIITPMIAALVAWCVAKMAVTFPELASTVNQAEITAFVWGLLLAAVNLWTNKIQTDGTKSIQRLIDDSTAFPNVSVDGWVGPTMKEVVGDAISIVERTGNHVGALSRRAKPFWTKR
jgi:hypothetical protein